MLKFSFISDTNFQVNLMNHKIIIIYKGIQDFIDLDSSELLLFKEVLYHN